MEKSALAGIHGVENRALIKEYGIDYGYAVDLTPNFKEFMEKARIGHYSAVIMDLNLGDQNSDDISPAVEAYSLFEQRVKEGSIKFLGVSGREEAIKEAQGKGIPAEKTTLEAIEDFFK
jgi:hypothetical protein